MDSNQITQIIIAVITFIIAPFVIRLTNAKVVEIAAKTKDARLKAVIADVGSAVATAVDSLAQTTVESLKAASADGKLTADDAKSILNQAAAKAETMLTADTIAFVQEQSKDVGEYLIDKIEAYIKSQKEANNA